MDKQNDKIIVTILETSDVHGNILPISYANNKLSPLGLAKICTLVKLERQSNKNTILIDNGDFLQGTPLTYHHCRLDQKSENPMIKVMNHMVYDALVVGNHEFNYGQSILEKAFKESNFPWLSANIIKSSSKEVLFGKPYIVKEFKGGLKIGILGVTTHYIPNWENPDNIKGIEFTEALDTTRKWVKIMQDEGVHFIIVSYHGGFEKDPETGKATENETGENQGYRMCHEIQGLDVLLAGHQHSRTSGKELNGVTILQPGSNGQFIGKVSVAFENIDGKWKVSSKESELLDVGDISPDPDVIKMMEPYEEKTQVWLDQPIGKINGQMAVKNHHELRLKDNQFIEFINNVQMHYAKADISNTALFDNCCPGFKHDVTMRDIAVNYAYPNTLRVLRLKGRDIKEALERSASYFDKFENGIVKLNPEFVTPKPQHYNYDMWEGIEYKINISHPVGQRVVKLNYKGSPLDMEGEYDVVMNNYRAGGGGDYLMFKDKPVIRDIPTDVSELIASYIIEKGTIEATLDNNWEIVHE